MDDINETNLNDRRPIAMVRVCRFVIDTSNESLWDYSTCKAILQVRP